MKSAIARAIGRGCGVLAGLPFARRAPEVAPPQLVPHARWAAYLAAHFNRPGMRVLEVGSRNVTGWTPRSLFPEAEYVGFDFYPGDTVDVVGDAHRLSAHFEPETRFDLILSSAVFEHLAMPWVVAVEMHRMLKVGGVAFVETHFSYASHERPWHFFQFSDAALRCLFNEALGFEVLDSGMSNPINGYFSAAADPYLRYQPVPELYCHSEILCRKVRETSGFDWGAVALEAVVGDARYPAPAADPLTAAR